MKPSLKPLATALIAGGVLLAAWPFGQTLYGRWSQRSLAAQFQSEVKAPFKAAPRTQVVAVPAPKVAPWPLTRITASDINLDAYVVQGWDDASLRRGPGHYERSSPPGEGNCVVAGHRNVYGSPFGNVDKLYPGQNIVLSNKNGTYTYSVDSIETASASDWRVTLPPARGARPILTLLTCTLPHTPSRVVVRALLTQ